MDDQHGNVQVEASRPSPGGGTIGEGDHHLPSTSAVVSPGSDQVSMPICFLVREHAKSLVAIKDLQKRLQQVEGVQGEVISVINDVHDFLSVSAVNDNVSYPKSPTSVLSPASQDNSNLLGAKRNTSLTLSSDHSKNSKLSLTASFSPKQEVWKKEVTECDPNGMHKSLRVQVKDSQAPESEGKDSGLDSDCRDNAQECLPLSHVPQNLVRYSPSIAVQQPDSDELSCLLDEISEKSQMLRSQVSSSKDDSIRTQPSPHLGLEMTRLHLEHLGLRHMLSDIKDERDDLQAKIENLETTTDQLSTDKMNLEHRFISALVEKHQLENKLHKFAWEVSRNSSSKSPGDSAQKDLTSDGLMTSPNRNRKVLCKVDSKLVSSILKENNVVDLQKDVLTYMMENEVLHTKLDQTENLLAKKEIEKQHIERANAEEIQFLASENEQFRLGFEEQKLEIVALKSKVRMLERVLQSVTLENQELNLQLSESMSSREAVLKNKTLALQRLTYSDDCSPQRLSLPAQGRNEQDVTISCAKAKFLPNTSSYLDITFEDNPFEADLAGTSKTPFALNQYKASTPLARSQSQTSPKLTQNVHSSIAMSHRRPFRHLTFNAVKAGSQSNHLLSDGHRNIDRLKHKRAAGSANHLPSDNQTDSHTFPFQTIIEKLKTNTEYKLPNRTYVAEQTRKSDTNSPERHNVTLTGSDNGKKLLPTPVEPTKCNSSYDSNQEEDNSTYTKDKKPNQSKNIQKRIQNILDRIRSESEDVMV